MRTHRAGIPAVNRRCEREITSGRRLLAASGWPLWYRLIAKKGIERGEFLSAAIRKWPNFVRFSGNDLAP